MSVAAFSDDPPAPPPAAPARRRLRVVQADFWPADPHPAQADRLKPRSLGLEPLTAQEEVVKLDLDRRGVPASFPLPSRSECRGGHRPCPLIHCPSNLYGYLTPAGAYKIAFPHREPWEMPPDESCALDIADAHDSRNPKTDEEIARLMNHTRPRVQQLKASGLDKLKGTAIGRRLLAAEGR